MARDDEAAVLEKLGPADGLEMDVELFDEAFDAEALLASIEATLEDAEPWQRLSEILGRITGEIDDD